MGKIVHLQKSLLVHHDVILLADEGLAIHIFDVFSVLLSTRKGL
jgi:hypothetical protein